MCLIPTGNLTIAVGRLYVGTISHDFVEEYNHGIQVLRRLSKF